MPTDRDRRGQDVVIRELLRTPSRYFRSVHLERDFSDPGAVEHYILTPAMTASFGRVLEGLRPGSGRRAWRVTGDYGSGKSSFALVLAHLLCNPSAPALARLRKAVDVRGLGVKRARVVPVLVTGARESLVPAIARAVAQAIEQLRGRGRPPKALAELSQLAVTVARGADAGSLVELLQDVTAYVVGAGHSGILLVLDELGKFLEYAALHPEREDVYTLQRIAEVAARSGDQPIFVLGLLHQGFHAYAERLPSTARHEWEKVAERYDEIVFDQPLAHTAALVSGALHVDLKRLPEAVERRARIIGRAIQGTGWFRGCLAPGGSPTNSAAVNSGSADAFDPLAVYPLHPTLLPVLIRFFARFGQHERSLFSFLLSSEPFALQHFSGRCAAGEAWYRLADFYDYVRAVFGHRLAGASYRSQWLRIVGVVDGIGDLRATELRVLKTVAVLNLLDADHLLATDAVLVAAIGEGGGSSVAAAVGALVKRGILYYRGAAGGYCLWPTTSVNLEAALEAARRALGPIDGVAAHLKPYLDTRPLLARRHSIVTGTLRYFEVRYAGVAELHDVARQQSGADGIVLVALCDTTAQRFEALGATTTEALAVRPDVVVAVPPPLQSMTAEVQDARCWRWVAENTPELAHDTYAAAEVARQLAASRRAVAARLAEFTGLQVGHVSPSNRPGAGVTWMRAGQPLEAGRGRGLLSTLSDICDALYNQAPRIRNELLNRRTLSSPAAAARMRLIERMFTASDQALLGIDPVKAPPEKSMYLSVLFAGNVHRQERGRFILGEPPFDADPLRLRPALRRVMELLEEADGHRVPVESLNAALRGRPFGVRAGVVPFLVAVVATSHAHELAVYENGTFLQRFGPSDFLRLTKLPTAFEFQLCRVTGVRLDVFNQLAEVFASARARDRRAELLDVVSPLCVFAAQLPEFTRKSTALPAAAVSVRDSLLSAREPGPLLFQDLPLACGVGAFSPDESADRRRVRVFVAALRAAMDDLRAAFPQLLLRVGSHAAHAVGEPAGPSGLPLDRAHLADRGRRVALLAREPRLRAFANRLADVGLDDDAWAEALGSFVLAKPPMRWAPSDETRACDEIDILAATFRRVEAVAFANHQSGQGNPLSAVRVGLTRGDGVEMVRVVHTRPEDQATVDASVARLHRALPASPELRMAALSQLLWSDLEGGPQEGTRPERAMPSNAGRESVGVSND
jgi:hypothetical protein